MSIPATLRAGPTTTNTLVMKRYVILHILIAWLAAIPPIYFLYLAWPIYYVDKIYFIWVMPLLVMGLYFVWMFGAVFIAKIMLIIINLIHKPREGYFPRDPKNKDYRFWSLRATIKKFPIWLIRNFSLPWIDIICMKIFGIKASMATALFDAFVDTEFIEIGKNTIIGQGSVIMSSQLTRDWLIIKKVKIGNNVVIGAHSVVSPGTVIGDNTILGALAGTTIDQHLESGWVYMGVPARKYKKNEYESPEESEEEQKRKRGLFKQFLTIEEIEELESRSRKERKPERKLGREIRKQEKLLEKGEKLLEKHRSDLLKHEKIISELENLDTSEMSEKERQKIMERIEKERLKKEELEEKISELEKQQESIHKTLQHNVQKIKEMLHKEDDPANYGNP